jgi:hypothetical protein
MSWTQTRAAALAVIGALALSLLPGSTTATAKELAPQSVTWTKGATVTVYGKDTTKYKGKVTAGGYSIPSGHIAVGAAKMTVKSGTKTLAKNVTSKLLSPGTYTTFNTISYRKVISTAYQDTAYATMDFLPGSGQGVTCTVNDVSFSYTDYNTGIDFYTYSLDCDPTSWIIDTYSPDNLVDGTVPAFSYSFDSSDSTWSTGDTIDMSSWSDGSTEPTPVDVSWDYIAGSTRYGPVLTKHIKRTVIVKKLIRKPKSLSVNWDYGASYYVEPVAWINDNYGGTFNKKVKLVLQYNNYGSWKTVQTRYADATHDAVFHFIYGTGFGGWGAGEYRVYCPLLKRSSVQLLLDA